MACRSLVNTAHRSPPIRPLNHTTRNAPLLRASRQTSPPFSGHVAELAFSAAAPFVAMHPPLIANRLSILDSSRRVEPWRVGECSLTCEGRFFVVMHRTAIVLPQPMAVVQIEEAFLQLIDSQDFFLWCISGQGTPFLGAMRVWGRLPHFSHRVIHSFCA